MLSQNQDLAFPYQLHPEVEDWRMLTDELKTLASKFEFTKCIALLEVKIHPGSSFYNNIITIKNEIAADTQQRETRNILNSLMKLIDELQEQDLKSYRLLQTVLFPKRSEVNLKELLAKGDLKEVIDIMMKRAGQSNRDLEKPMIMLSARYNTMEKNKQAGIISTSEYDMERNQIMASLLELMDEL